MIEDKPSVYERAIQSLVNSKLKPDLIEAAVLIVPTIPLTKEGHPYCRACESVLCGACGSCHSLDHAMNDPECPEDYDDMGSNCAKWWQAHHSVWCEIYHDMRDEREAKGQE